MDVLVDFDLDYCFDASEDITLAPAKGRHGDADRAIEWAVGLKAKHRALVVDHNEALAHWDVIRVLGATVFHIDAHHDMFGDDPRVWRRPLGARGAQIGVGDYLLQALREDVVKSVDWIVPPWTNAAAEMPKLRRQAGGWYANKVCIRPFSKDLPLCCTHLTVSISPEWIPPESRAWVREVLERLRFPSHQVQRALHRCDARWKQCLATPEAMRPYRFVFDYAYAPQLQ